MTQWQNRGAFTCPVHGNPIRRGTRRCMACTSDVALPRRQKLGLPPQFLSPMREKGQPTKRVNERRTKGYARG